MGTRASHRHHQRGNMYFCHCVVFTCGSQHFDRKAIRSHRLDNSNTEGRTRLSSAATASTGQSQIQDKVLATAGFLPYSLCIHCTTDKKCRRDYPVAIWMPWTNIYHLFYPTFLAFQHPLVISATGMSILRINIRYISCK